MRTATIPHRDTHTQTFLTHVFGPGLGSGSRSGLLPSHYPSWGFGTETEISTEYETSTSLPLMGIWNDPPLIPSAS